MKLSVIIVNYQVKFYLAQCIHSVVKSMNGIDGEIIVVDNDSKDNSIEFLRNLYPEVRYIENKENVGFAKANNEAIRLSYGDYVLLLNPDTIINEHFLQDCIVLLDYDDNICATGTCMLNQNGTFAPESRRGIPTPFTAFCKMVALNRLFPKSRIFGRYYMKYLDENSETPIEIISGACMFIRKSIFDECEMLDEDFFMYGEDIDLSYRMLLTGKKNYYLPSRIVHYKGESTQKNTLRYVYVFYEAMYIFFKKHYDDYNWILSVPIRSVIYLKGLSEYISRKIRGLFEKEQTVLNYIQGQRFLLKGSNKSLESMVAICEKYDLTFDVKEKPAICPDYIVYDVDVYSYDYIIKEVETRSKDLRTRVNLATYSATLGCIITVDYVFEQ